MHAASVYAESDRERVSKQERARVVEKVGESHTQFTHAVCV